MNDYREITAYPNYEISSIGQIRSNRSETGYDYPLKPCVASNYYTIKLTNSEGDRRTCLVHRLVWTTHRGEIAAGMTINHKDGNKLNNDVNNLEVMTQAENLRHARNILGRKMGSPTNEERREAVKLLILHGWSQHKIAKAFGWSQGYVSQMLKK